MTTISGTIVVLRKDMTTIRLILCLLSTAWMSHATAGAIESLPDPTRPASFHNAREAGQGGLQTTVVSDGRRVAVIDGRMVNIGDKVGDAVVVDIRPYEVVLRSNSGTRVLRMMPPLTRSMAKTAANEHEER